MPICEIDPWRMQYFRRVACPDHVRIPTEDADAWDWYPEHRWVYDKLTLALAFGLEAGPHGTSPPRFPVFSKPIVNLRGMGAGSRIVDSPAAYQAAHAPGHFWMTLLDGAHVSSDAALIDGRPVWWRHATGAPGPGGTFDVWTVHARELPEIESTIGGFLASRLRGYTGLVNVETIGGRLIEAHLRLTDQWPDLYGEGWLQAVVDLYARGTWRFDDRDRRKGWSLALFGPHGRRWRHPPAEVVAEAASLPGVSSIQITFHEDRPPERHSMPPGGFRLALVNAVDLAAGRAARDLLREHFLGAGRPANLA